MATTGNLTSKASLANIRDAASKAAEQLKPLGNTAAQRFSMATQYAKEQLNKNSDVTELPPKYRDLEEKVDKIKATHEAFLKLSGTYSKKHYDYVPVFSETAKDMASVVSAGWTSLITGSTPVANPNDEVPPSLSHAYCKAAKTSAASLGSEEPFAVALNKFGDTHEAIGEARLKMDEAIIEKFHKPYTTTLNQLIQHANRARRNVQGARLNYDAARAKMKSVKPGSEEGARAEMEATEDAFVAAVDDAMSKMTLVVESPEPLRNLADLVAAQLNYFKAAHEALAALSPEIDELQITSEALRNSA
ncbi:BAR domain-containing family protein [Obelidium mucronatum]|nr:BAR domain-containing family protein [Obelidium mucronatum]